MASHAFLFTVVTPSETLSSSVLIEIILIQIIHTFTVTFSCKLSFLSDHRDII